MTLRAKIDVVFGTEMSEGDKDVLAVILEAGTTGLSRAAIAGRANRTLVAIENVSRRLRDRGLIEATTPSGGPVTRWGAPGTAERYARETAHSEYRRRAAREARTEASHKAKAEWREPVRYASVWDYGLRGGAA